MGDWDEGAERSGAGRAERSGHSRAEWSGQRGAERNRRSVAGGGVVYDQSGVGRTYRSSLVKYHVADAHRAEVGHRHGARAHVGATKYQQPQRESESNVRVSVEYDVRASPASLSIYTHVHATRRTAQSATTISYDFSAHAARLGGLDQPIHDHLCTVWDVHSRIAYGAHPGHPSTIVMSPSPPPRPSHDIAIMARHLITRPRRAVLAWGG